MRRIFAGLVALLVAWLGCAQPASAAVAVLGPAQIYTHDNHHHSVLMISAVPERGPPTYGDTRVITHNATDHWSHGAAARLGAAGIRIYTAHDPDMPLEQVQGGGAITERAARATEGVLRPASGAMVAAKTADEFVDLASASRRTHILDGEVRPNGSFGGGHRPGTGFPGKSEFPHGWSDDRIMHEISDIATDPSLTWRAGNRPGDFFVNGTRDGIDVEVLIRNNQIWTGYPTNVARNP
jgi:EndoU nuclease-like protein